MVLKLLILFHFAVPVEFLGELYQSCDEAKLDLFQLFSEENIDDSIELSDSFSQS